MAQKKKKKGKQQQKEVSVNLKIRLELEKQAQKPKRVKRIVSRRRPNLREMRRGMGGSLGQQMSSSNFFGNTAMLSNAAMAAMNNKSYALERQIRDNQAEIKAFINAGRGDDARIQQLQQQNQTLLGDLEVTQRQGRRDEQQLRKSLSGGATWRRGALCISGS